MSFRPGWKLSLFFIVFLPCLVALGFWQLQRAEEKRAILDVVIASRAAPPMSLRQLLQTAQPAYQQVKLRGQYLNERIILLDNQMYQGRFGYEVVMPFRSVDGEVLLVSRGWVPGSMRREQLPQLQAIVGTVEVLGEVYVPLGEVFALGSTALPRGWPKRMQTLDHGALAGALGVELYPYVVRLKPGTATAFESHWQDVNIAPEKHIAYAVQWFSMAIALLLLYLAAAFGFINSKQRMRR